jgi:Abnormal spindle-like microcephaly-assoc'd, ASPM-SPD-2-Hydin
MKRSARRPLYVAYVVVAAGAVAALANCGGSGERPLVREDPFDGGAMPDTGKVDKPTLGGVTISGFDPAAGILFGDDGLVNCGSQAEKKEITIANASTDIVKFNAKITAGKDLYKLNAEEGSVPARGVAALQIVPSPIPQTSEVTPDLYAGTLEIQLSTGEPPTVIRLHQTARGAIVTTTLAPEKFDFGDVKVATTGTHQFSMTNAGNVEVTANLALGTDNFKVDNAKSATMSLQPGQTASKTLTLSPLDTVPYTDNLTVTFNAVHCKPPPGNTELKGKGATAVLVTPGTVNFGQIDCGGPPAAPQIVTITSTAQMEFKPVLLDGETGTSPYTLENAATGQPVTTGNWIPMAASSTFQLKVVPRPIPSAAKSTANNGYGDTLRIETTAPGDAPHITTLNQTARGAVFTMTPTSLAVSDKPVGHQKSTPFQIANIGNQAAPYLISVALDPNQPSAAPDSFSLNDTVGTLGPGSAGKQLTLDTRAPASGQVTGKIELKAGLGAVMCADLPPKMTVTIDLTP